MEDCSFSFTPESRPGAKNPPLLDKLCHGVDLTGISLADLQRKARIDLSYVVDAFRRMKDKEQFFLKNKFFDLLTGQRHIRQMILDGHSAQEIEATWKEDTARFREQRRKYLIYPE
jgi:uncharacterized protein YbbC (DUF1343 family)